MERSRCTASARLCCTALFATSLSTAALAVPIDDLQRGDIYLMHHLFGPNDRVMVLSVDRSTGRVKVQYENGGVDYVNASDLQTQTQSRNADTVDAIAGTALIGGTLWAILDPDGFKKAMNDQRRASDAQGQQAGSSFKSAPTVTVSALPFAPVLPGEWANQGSEWIAYAQQRIESGVGERRTIESVRTKPLPFYSTKKAVLAECIEPGHTGAYYLLVVLGSDNGVMLDGTGRNIHAFNRSAGLVINNGDDAVSYAQFFSSAISAPEGIFLVLKPDMKDVDAVSLRSMRVRPIEVATDDTGWRIGANIVYGRDVSWVHLHVAPNGTVEILDEQLEQHVAFDYQVVMQNGRRVYVTAK